MKARVEHPLNAKTVTTYEFQAFPVMKWHSSGRKRLKWDPLSRFSFDTLKEAQREIARLIKIYKEEDARRLKDPKRQDEARLLHDYSDMPDFLMISKVDRTPIVPRPRFPVVPRSR